MIVGVLIMLTGLWLRLGRLVASIPTPIAQAMLAGVGLESCLAPVRSFVAPPGRSSDPPRLGLTLRGAPKWPVVTAFAAAPAVITTIDLQHGGWHYNALSRLDPTAPRLTRTGLIGLELPLYTVTICWWTVAVVSGCAYSVLVRISGAVTTFVRVAPEKVVGAVAGWRCSPALRPHDDTSASRSTSGRNLVA